MVILMCMFRIGLIWTGLAKTEAQCQSHFFLFPNHTARQFVKLFHSFFLFLLFLMIRESELMVVRKKSRDIGNWSVKFFCCRIFSCKILFFLFYLRKALEKKKIGKVETLFTELFTVLSASQTVRIGNICIHFIHSDSYFYFFIHSLVRSFVYRHYHWSSKESLSRRCRIGRFGHLRGDHYHHHYHHHPGLFVEGLPAHSGTFQFYSFLSWRKGRRRNEGVKQSTLRRRCLPLWVHFCSLIIMFLLSFAARSGQCFLSLSASSLLLFSLPFFHFNCVVQSADGDWPCRATRINHIDPIRVHSNGEQRQRQTDRQRTMKKSKVKKKKKKKRLRKVNSRCCRTLMPNSEWERKEEDKVKHMSDLHFVYFWILVPIFLYSSRLERG